MRDPAEAERTTPKQINLPTLVIAGDRDGAIDVARFRAAHHLFDRQHYSYVQLAGVGHFPQIEKSAATADAIVNFLTSAPDWDAP